MITGEISHSRDQVLTLAMAGIRSWFGCCVCQFAGRRWQLCVVRMSRLVYRVLLTRWSIILVLALNIHTRVTEALL